jgi:predicted ATPase
VRAESREPDAWFWQVPAVAQVRDQGLPLAPVTVFVGENRRGESTVVEGIARPQGGIWLRAGSMHELFASGDRQAIELRAFDGVPLNTRSHGEGFLAFLESRVAERGLWILDEPESALSFRSCLRLLALLHAMTTAGTRTTSCWTTDHRGAGPTTGLRPSAA